MTAYHITDQRHARQIMEQNCLVPSIGENSRFYETRPLVYLCAREFVANWMCILNKDTVLEVQLEDGVLSEYAYTGYSEYYADQPLYPEEIRDVSKDITETERIEANTAVCSSYLWQLNRLCVGYGTYYDLGSGTLEDLIDDTRFFLYLVGHLDYKAVPKQQLLETMEEMEDSCCYAFTDVYHMSGKRMWEQLIHYPEDESAPLRRQLYDFVAEHVPQIAYYQTGGWMAGC